VVQQNEIALALPNLARLSAASVSTAPQRQLAARSLLCDWFRLSTAKVAEQADAPVGDAPADAPAGPSAGVESDDCAICLDSLDSTASGAVRPLQLSPRLRLTPLQPAHLPHCRHAFHLACLEKLLHTGSLACPVCRASLLPPELAELEDALAAPDLARLAAVQVHRQPDAAEFDEESGPPCCPSRGRTCSRLSVGVSLAFCALTGILVVSSFLRGRGGSNN
jgi:hypothetical protein